MKFELKRNPNRARYPVCATPRTNPIIPYPVLLRCKPPLDQRIMRAMPGVVIEYGFNYYTLGAEQLL